MSLSKQIVDILQKTEIQTEIQSKQPMFGIISAIVWGSISTTKTEWTNRT